MGDLAEIGRRILQHERRLRAEVRAIDPTATFAEVHDATIVRCREEHRDQVMHAIRKSACELYLDKELAGALRRAVGEHLAAQDRYPSSNGENE